MPLAGACTHREGMTLSTPHVVVFAAALLYAVGALVVKRSADLGAGAWRTVFVSNVVTGLLYQPLLVLGGEWHPGLWWQPVIIALCFILGQWLAFVSLEVGDVSVATPVLGLKILLVAFFSTLLGGEHVPGKLWFAAVLATLGIALLNRRTGTEHHHVGRTILTAGLAAGAFALFDVLVQKWSPGWGLGHFLPLTIGLGGVLSFAFVPKFSAPLSALSGQAWRWLLGGTTLIAVQSLLFVTALAKWGHAASINVIYGSRGLWSVLLVWGLGHLVQSRESQLGGRILAWRLAGAMLMMSAIVLVLT